MFDETNSGANNSQPVNSSPLISVNSDIASGSSSQTNQESETTIRDLWKMMLATMPIRESRTAHGICEAMLQQYNHIPYDRWKHTVRAILMGESLREGSPIQYTKFKGEDLFGVRVNTNVWLSIHQDYVPRYRDVSQIKGTGSVPKVSSWETSSKKNRTALDDTIAGFDPLSAVIPPGMKRGTAQSLICDIACMGDPDYRDTAIKALLRHPDNKGVIYAGDLWAIALHNGPIARFIFDILCELADKNKAWDEIVLRLRDYLLFPPASKS